MTESILALDRQLFLLLNFNGGAFWDNFFWIVSGKLVWAPLYIFILWLIYKKAGKWNMLAAFALFALGVGLCDQICNFFKVFVPKARPTHTEEFEGLINIVKGYRGKFSGSVSAHAAISFFITTFSSMIIRNKIFTISMVLWAAIVAYSRIYLGMHFPLDILFGTITGITVGYLLFLVYQITIKKIDKRLKRDSNRLL